MNACTHMYVITLYPDNYDGCFSAIFSEGSVICDFILECPSGLSVFIESSLGNIKNFDGEQTHVEIVDLEGK